MNRYIVFVRDRVGCLAFWFISLAVSPEEAAKSDADLRHGSYMYDVFELGDMTSFVFK